MHPIRRLLSTALLTFGIALGSIGAAQDHETLIYASYEDIKDWDPAKDRPIG